MSPILGIYASQISGHLFAPAGAYDSIATVTASGGETSLSFSSIPSTYSHLQIRYMSKESSSGFILMRINGSASSSDYIYLHYITGDGSSASAGAATSSTYIYAGTQTAGITPFGVGVIDILDYANTSKFKTVRGLSGWDNNGTGTLIYNSGAYIKTTAISSITVYPGSSTFSQYSKFALYGIKG
jgi:hypothetical protein